jgi:GNAT superfamily N-acetyltransferase
MTIDIAPMAAADEVDWRRLWRGYCDFYQAPVTEAQTALTWSRILDPDHVIQAFIARDAEGVALGMVTYQRQASTWVPGGDVYLEDLYVDPETRGAGVGRALIQAVEDAARALGCDRLFWHTGRDNTRARALYDKVAGPEDAHVRYRMMLT